MLRVCRSDIDDFNYLIALIFGVRFRVIFSDCEGACGLAFHALGFISFFSWLVSRSGWLGWACVLSFSILPSNLIALPSDWGRGFLWLNVQICSGFHWLWWISILFIVCVYALYLSA